ncbi:MAG: class II aldolase/adducin family protein [Calditrichia bacterium]
MKYKKERELLIETGKHLYEKELISGSEGNLSLRLNEEEILTTPSGLCKGKLKPADLVIVDLNGKVKSGQLPVSSEILLHLEYYNNRKDVHAVIHSHPVNCISLMLAGISLNRPYLPEMVVMLGVVPTASYATPSTDEVPKSIQKYVKKTDAILLDHHGAVVGSQDMQTALLKLETLEHAAEAIVKAYQIRRHAPRSLNKDAVKTLIKLRKERYKVPGAFIDEFQFS